MNLGPVPRVPLPFSCTMISSAAVEDVETVVVSKKRHLVAMRCWTGFFWGDASTKNEGYHFFFQ